MTDESSDSWSADRIAITAVAGFFVLYGLVHLGTTVYLLIAPYGDSIADGLFWTNLIYGGVCCAPAFLFFVLAVTASNKDQGAIPGMNRMFAALAFLIANILILNWTNAYVQSNAPPGSFDVTAERPLERDDEGTAETTASVEVSYRSSRYTLTMVLPATVTDSLKLQRQREKLERCLEEGTVRVTNRGEVVATDTLRSRRVSLNRDATPPVFEVYASHPSLKTGPARISVRVPQYDSSCPSVRPRFEAYLRSRPVL